MTEDPAPYRTFPSQDDTPLTRIFEAAECHTQVELAALLGIRQSSISDAKRRNAIPAEWLVKLLRLKRINPEWILTGLGPKCLGPASDEPPTHVVYLKEIKPHKECSAQELVTELVRRALVDM